MMKSIPFVVGMLLLIAMALGWFLFSREEAQTLLDQPELEISEEAQQPKRNLDHSSLEVANAESPAEGVGVEDLAENKEAIQVAADEESVLVRVVGKEDGSTVEGIAVFTYTDETLKNRVAGKRMPYYDRIQRFGNRYCSDSDGLVRVRPEGPNMRLLALSAELFGLGSIRELTTEVTVEVSPYPAVLVRVVDERGDLVLDGAVVGRLYRENWGDPQVTDVAKSWINKASGLTRLKILDPGGLDSGDFYRVAVDGLFDPPVETTIDTENLPTEPIVLVLPPSGSMRVQIEDSNGTISTNAKFYVTLTLGSEDSSKPGGLGATDKTSVLMPMDGLAESGHLALGHDWVVTLRPVENAHYEEMSQRVAGPKEDGEVVEVRFQLPDQPTRCVVRGRALDEVGKPLAELLLRTTSELKTGAGGSSERSAIKTDSDGTFEAAFDAKEAVGRTRWFLSFSHRVEEEVEHRFVTEFTGKGPGIYELGDVQLLPVPVLVAGRVIGPDGEGLLGVNLMLRSMPEAGERQQSPLTTGHYYANKSRDDGSFELRGDLEGADFALTAQNEGFQFQPMVVARGQEGVLIRATALARLTATVLPWAEGPSTTLAGFVYSLQREGGPLRGRSHLDDDGRIDDYKEAGRYNFSIAHSSDSKKALYECEGLVLEAGKTLDLGKITLKSPGTKVEITVEADLAQVKTTRRSLPGCIRSFSPGGSEALQEFYVNVAGTESHILYVDALPIEIEVEVRGFRAQRWTMTEHKDRVVLKPGIEVQLRFGGFTGLPENAVAHLVLGHNESDSKQRGRPWGTATCHADFDCKEGGTSVLLTRPGLYSMRVSVGYRIPGGTSTSGVLQQEPIELHVFDRNEPQSVQINVDPTIVEAALSSLTEKR